MHADKRKRSREPGAALEEHGPAIATCLGRELIGWCT